MRPFRTECVPFRRKEEIKKLKILDNEFTFHECDDSDATKKNKNPTWKGK